MSDYCATTATTAEQLKLHIAAAYRTHARLTGFAPNTIVIHPEQLNTLLIVSDLNRYARFDDPDYWVRDMLVVLDIYSDHPRLMFEYRPVK